MCIGFVRIIGIVSATRCNTLILELVKGNKIRIRLLASDYALPLAV